VHPEGEEEQEEEDEGESSEEYELEDVEECEDEEEEARPLLNRLKVALYMVADTTSKSVLGSVRSYPFHALNINMAVLFALEHRGVINQ
jgi:hypothetical protein